MHTYVVSKNRRKETHETCCMYVPGPCVDRHATKPLVNSRNSKYILGIYENVREIITARDIIALFLVHNVYYVYLQYEYRIFELYHVLCRVIVHCSLAHRSITHE